MKKKYLIFTLYLFCCFYVFGSSNNDISDNIAVPNIVIDKVTVEVICNSPTSITYNFEIDLCGIHAPNGNPPASIYTYIRPNSNNSWMDIGAASLVNSSNYIYTATITTAAPLSAESWHMQATYTYANPATFGPGTGYDFCSSQRLFPMPAPPPNCGSCIPDEITITANDAHDITTPLTYTVPCGQECIIINATNITNAVYNTSAPVLNDLNGLFCNWNGLESFVVDITGRDSCGDPYSEQVTIVIPQDCPEIECCEGDDNILDNGDFNDATCGGNGAFNNGCVPNWSHTERTPSIHGFGTNPFAWMWSYNNRGEGIVTDFDFEEGETYTICFRIMADDKNSGDPNVANNATINFVATNNAGAIVANPTGDLIFQETMGPYLNVWTTISVQFTPTADFSQLWIFPFMADPSDGISQAELSVDDISICCPEKELSIVPFWDHPDCPEVVCEAENWPIHVIDGNGNFVTSAGGVTIEWTNVDTGNVLNQDFVYAHPQENWSVKVTYPNGCTYTATYYEDCCDDEVFIEAIICPNENNLQEFERELEVYGPRMDEETYRQQLEALEKLREQVEREDCDPCDIGFIMIRLVDANGNPIDASDYTTITWSDGGFGTFRIIPVDFAVTVTLTQLHKHYECTYTDTFIYDCEKDCKTTAPTNVQVNGTTVSWDPVPGAVGYIVEPAIAWPINCFCEAPISLLPIQTTATSVVIPMAPDACTVVQVRARCADGTYSPPSGVVCVNGHSYVKGENLGKISVSPNPNNGLMTFSIEANEASEVTIEIRNIYGKMVYSTVTNVNTDSKKSLSWDGTGKLTSGMYFITFKTAKETIIKKVFIK